jgi:hypothetical protein
MAKPVNHDFTQVFEPVLLSAWGAYAQSIEGNLLRRTRKAIAQVRRIYTFKKESTSKLRFGIPKNRVGYLAAFGQRHAYLGFVNLNLVAQRKPASVPRPKMKGELTITTIGAGAAIEIYGFLLWYNQHTQVVRKLRVNCVEKVDAWKSTRQIVFSQWFRRVFPKTDIIPYDVDVDITKPETIRTFANHHERLLATDILLIYNVLNEIEQRHALAVWKNLKYILRQADKPILVLLMEPSADKIRPRIDWMRTRLMESGTVILDEDAKRIDFNEAPYLIKMEGDGKGINDRLFGRSPGMPAVTFQTGLERQVMACVVDPRSPISKDIVESQLAVFQQRRSGRFPKKHSDEHQLFLSFEKSGLKGARGSH